MSSNQLDKLNLMVEKLLETATLDSESLEFIKEPIDVVALINHLVSRNEIQFGNKSLVNNIKDQSIIIHADAFHLENALNNIFDNAVKYGGDEIIIESKNNGKEIEISISDNGNTLTKAHSHRLFEKFYRIPKGNTHDIKGYGIGLYYTKSIIEKHGGTIDLILDNKLTTFRITLPNE
jgi:two-component system phosphate regulon sensor histidine kinase PhoR